MLASPITQHIVAHYAAVRQIDLAQPKCRRQRHFRKLGSLWKSRARLGSIPLNPLELV
jgi:hypothetical protein